MENFLQNVILVLKGIMFFETAFFYFFIFMIFDKYMY
jgi:hypothetical protein